MVVIKSQVRKTGHSLCIILNKEMLRHVTKLKEGDEIELDYNEFHIDIKKSGDAVARG